jgi:hypothetical protein
MRSAIASAVFIGNERLLNETLEGCRDFLRAIEADLFSLIPATEELSVEALAVDESESAGETQTEEIRLVKNPTPTEAERALQIFAHEESALVRLINWCNRAARQPSMRIAQ